MIMIIISSSSSSGGGCGCGCVWGRGSIVDIAHFGTLAVPDFGRDCFGKGIEVGPKVVLRDAAFEN